MSRSARSVRLAVAKESARASLGLMREFSKELRLSETTVKCHLSNIYKKIEVSSRSDAVKKALPEQ